MQCMCCVVYIIVHMCQYWSDAECVVLVGKMADILESSILWLYTPLPLLERVCLC